MDALVLLQHETRPDLPAVDRNPYTREADRAQGKKLYAGRCAGCHGPTGDGGKGTSLATPSLPRASGDLALYRIIRYGLPETEMPAHNMTQREIWQIAAFVRTPGQSGSESVTWTSPAERTLYVAVREAGSTYFTGDAEYKKGEQFNGGGFRNVPVSASRALSVRLNPRRET